MDGSIAPVMAVTRKKAEQQVSGLEWPLNLRLATLLGFRAPAETRAVWKHEVRAWCGQVATLRIKPANRALPAATLLEWLYAERFAGSEVENAGAILALLGEELERNGASPEEVAEGLLRFHQHAARELSEGRVPLETIEAP